MKPFLLFLLIAAIGNVVYHIGQKTLSPAALPMVFPIPIAVHAFRESFSLAKVSGIVLVVSGLALLARR